MRNTKILFLFVSTIINITTTCLTVWKVNLVYFLDELVLLIKLFLSSVPNAELDHLSQYHCHCLVRQKMYFRLVYSTRLLLI